MIALRKVADLDVSAASGLVQHGPVVYVVADDETFLDVYAIATARRTARVSLFDDVLPDEPKARKERKPDLEALTALPDGRLLALGSGSTELRARGVVLARPDGEGEAPHDPRIIDLAPLYGSLRRRFPELNIEGAAACGGLIRLLQRGGAGRDNAVIDLDLTATLRRIDDRLPLDAELVCAVRSVPLGVLDGIALGFTDAAPIDESSAEIAFVAAAEDTDDPYEDGPCRGSVIGILDAEAHVTRVDRIAGCAKIEGLAVRPGVGLLMVADPDDRAQRAPLFEADWPWPPASRR
jgi:hypothetical protein